MLLPAWQTEDGSGHKPQATPACCSELMRVVLPWSCARNNLQVIILMVKPDAASVNVAGIHRMDAVEDAWAAAASVFQQHLAGVQLLTQQQVTTLQALCYWCQWQLFTVP